MQHTHIFIDIYIYIKQIYVLNVFYMYMYQIPQSFNITINN